jgi:hypothetical protein
MCVTEVHELKEVHLDALYAFLPRAVRLRKGEAGRRQRMKMRGEGTKRVEGTRW